MGLALGVGAADAFFEGDVVFFRNQEFCVVAFVFQFSDYLPCDFSGVGVFEEFAVWGAFAFGLDSVAVVD